MKFNKSEVELMRVITSYVIEGGVIEIEEFDVEKFNSKIKRRYTTKFDLNNKEQKTLKEIIEFYGDNERVKSSIAGKVFALEQKISKISKKEALLKAKEAAKYADYLGGDTKKDIGIFLKEAKKAINKG